MILANRGFQIWDFFVSFGHGKLSKIEMLLHHSLAAGLAIAGLHMGFGQYYGLFFMGCDETKARRQPVGRSRKILSGTRRDFPRWICSPRRSLR